MSRKRSVWCGVRETRQPKPPEIAPTLTIACAPRYAFSGIVLPARDPLEHRVHDLAHAQHRVAVAHALGERGVDEVPLGPDAQPERAEVAEHDLALGRLAEDAHVGDAAVADEVAGARGVAAVLRALRLAVLGLLDLAADRRDHDVAAQRDAGIGERAQRLDVAGERALHVRDAESEERLPVVRQERPGLEAGNVDEPWLAAGVRRVHVAVEHQGRPAAGAGADAEDVRAALLDLLPLHLQAHRPELVAHQLGHRLLVAGEAGRADGAARELDEPDPVVSGGVTMRRTPARAGGPARRTAGSARADPRPRARA